MHKPGLSYDEMAVVVRAYNAAMSQPSQITEAGGIALIADTVERQKVYPGRATITITETHFVVGTTDWAVELESANRNNDVRDHWNPSKFLLLLVIGGDHIETMLKLTLFSGDPIRFNKDLVILKMFLP